MQSDMQLEHHIEPELSGPTPRRIRPTSFISAKGIYLLRAFLIPFILVGLGAVLALLGALGLTLFGRTTTGQIVHRTEIPGKRSVYRIEYGFVVQGRVYYAIDNINSTVYAEAQVGSAVPVKYLPLLPRYQSIALLRGVNETAGIGMPLFFGLIWNGVTCVFLWIAYALPAIQRALYRSGRVTVGRIIDKHRTSSDGSRSYALKYEFVPEIGASSRPFRGSTSVSAAQYKAVEIGDCLTILYDPGKPHRSVAYRYGYYAVE
jgi:hypothetical protein